MAIWQVGGVMAHSTAKMRLFNQAFIAAPRIANPENAHLFNGLIDCRLGDIAFNYHAKQTAGPDDGSNPAGGYSTPSPASQVLSANRQKCTPYGIGHQHRRMRRHRDDTLQSDLKILC